MRKPLRRIDGEEQDEKRSVIVTMLIVFGDKPALPHDVAQLSIAPIGS